MMTILSCIFPRNCEAAILYAEAKRRNMDDVDEDDCKGEKYFGVLYGRSIVIKNGLLSVIHLQ